MMAGTIFYLSHQPGTGAPMAFPHQDKLYHFTGYSLLGLFLHLGWKKIDLRWLWAFGAIYAASDEIHQYFIPGRSCDPLDWLADNLGLFVSIYGTSWVSKNLKLSSQAKKE